MAALSRTYFDHAASTPVAPGVMRAMRPYFSNRFGNPGSLHSFGQEALAAVDRAREKTASILGASFREVIFTGSATEANNLALRGAVHAAMRSTRARVERPNIVMSAIEHESILETAAALAEDGVDVVRVAVSRDGRVDLAALGAALDGGTVLVSIMLGNNETGAVQPIAGIAKAIAEFRAAHPAAGPWPLLHTDAAQALQFLDCRPDALGVDLMTLSAHKIYGPKGIGALYVRGNGSVSNVLQPVLSGGGQEFGLRSGTENVPLIAGFAAAMEYIETGKNKHARRIASLKDAFLRGLAKAYPKMKVNGPKGGGLPHIANVLLPGMSAEDMLIRLDLAGIAIAAGSACTARSLRPSHVLRAMGLDDKRARESRRVSFGRPTTSAEVSRLVRALARISP